MIIFISSNADIYIHTKLHFILKTFLNDITYTMSGETKCFKVLNFVDNIDNKETLKLFGEIAKESAQNSDISKIVDTITSHYNENVFVHVGDFAALAKNIEMLRKRPFFIHVHIEFEISLLLKIMAIEEGKILSFITGMERTKKNHESVYSLESISKTVRIHHHYKVMSFYRFWKKTSRRNCLEFLYSNQRIYQLPKGEHLL